MGCPGSSLNTGNLWTDMTCITETTFLVLKDNVDVTSLYCEDQIKSIARYTGLNCENNGKEIEVGFYLGTQNFIRQIRICFDDNEKTTFYTEHTLTTLIENRQLSSQRPYFTEGKFFNLNGKDLYTLYSKKVQRQTINKQLNMVDLNSTVVIKNGTSPYFLSRGHLAPKGDFIYSAQQNASFYYVNAAPQWEIINAGSWNNLEFRIRNFVTKRGGDLQIITGTYDKLILSDYASSPLYLYYNPTKSSGIPIPKFFWKVVYDPISRKGVAFVGTNNPFLKKVEYICDSSVTNSITWIKLNNKNISNGVVYACDVDDLRKNISYIPKLQVDGLLKE